MVRQMMNVVFTCCPKDHQSHIVMGLHHNSQHKKNCASLVPCVGSSYPLNMNAVEDKVHRFQQNPELSFLNQTQWLDLLLLVTKRDSCCDFTRRMISFTAS